MGKIYYDEIFRFNQIELKDGEDIFEKILEFRKDDIDPDRFFLEYISSDELAKYDFDNEESLKNLRDDYCRISSPFMRMGGCNLNPDCIERGMRYGGMKLSDPYGRVPGVFDVTNHVITYSPIWPFFYEERDLIKWADDSYFTSMTFDEIILNQIDNGVSFRLHTGYYEKTKDVVKYGMWKFEEITKEQMLGYITNPDLAVSVRKRVNNSQK